MNFDTQIKNYIKTLSQILPDNFPDKTQILADMEQNLHTHILENPSASWNEITKTFGTPENLAESLISDFPKTDIAAELYQKKHTRFHMILSCILISVFCIFLIGYMIYRTYFAPPTKNEIHYIFDGTEVNSEEFDKKMDEP